MEHCDSENAGFRATCQANDHLSAIRLQRARVVARVCPRENGAMASQGTLLAPSHAAKSTRKNVSDVFVLIGSYLLLVFVLPLALSAVVSYRSLPRGRRCPQCRGDTLLLDTPSLRTLNAVNAGVVLQRRWCLCCEWEGMVRVRRQTLHARPGPAFPAQPATPAQPPAPAPASDVPTAGVPATQTLDVRSLHVDGTAWRVMLQCWTTTGLFYGRLVFVGPTGRLWLDAVEPFSGVDKHQVLGEAMSLPEPLLQRRLRRLVSG